jgi:hypothetical protein
MARAVFGPKDANRGPMVEVSLFKGGLPKRFPADKVRRMSESEASALPAYPSIQTWKSMDPCSQPMSPSWTTLNEKVNLGPNYQAVIPKLERRNRRSSQWPGEPQLITNKEVELGSARSTAAMLTSAAYSHTRRARDSAAKLSLLMDDEL